jgi:glycosyltransferase involved in cell wall biosynthesis
MVRSSWILFLDADDVFHPEKIAIIGNVSIKIKIYVRLVIHLIYWKGIVNRQSTAGSPFKLKMFSADDVLLKNPIVTPALAVSLKTVFCSMKKWCLPRIMILFYAPLKNLVFGF